MPEVLLASADGGVSTVPLLARRIRIGGWPAVA